MNNHRHDALLDHIWDLYWSQMQLLQQQLHPSQPIRDWSRRPDTGAHAPHSSDNR